MKAKLEISQLRNGIEQLKEELYRYQQAALRQAEKIRDLERTICEKDAELDTLKATVGSACRGKLTEKK